MLTSLVSSIIKAANRSVGWVADFEDPNEKQVRLFKADSRDMPLKYFQCQIKVHGLIMGMSLPPMYPPQQVFVMKPFVI